MMFHLRLLTAILLLTSPLASLAQNKPQPEIKWDKTDLGPFHTGCFKFHGQIIAKGIAIKVGDKDNPATVLFDPELLRVSAAWTGGFIRFPRGRGGLEGQITPDGEDKFSTGYKPGWAKGETLGDDPRDRHQGHLPPDVAKYRGLYLNGDKVILHYTVGTATVLELEGSETRGDARIFTRTITMGATKDPHTMLICSVPPPKGDEGKSAGATTVSVSVDGVTVSVGSSALPPGAKLSTQPDGSVVLNLPPLSAPATFQVAISNQAEAPKPGGSLPNLVSLIKGGPAHWGAALETPGKTGTGDGPYVVDEITAPDDNPYNSWLRFGGHDFFPNGDAAIVNISGDVWIVSGLDAKLEHVKWKRFATGLFQPLGCKVVDGKIYVLGRDQITRLHDLNGDGEADYYECFNNDCVVTDNYHEFALDLQTDSKGNFYYGKGSPWTPTNTSPHQGTLIRVSRDGSKFEIVCNGLRAPNGLGIGPKDFITCSDNQGHWMPANRLNIIKPGGFYGMTPAAHKVLHFKAADGTEFDANPSSAEDRAKFKTEFWGNAQVPIPTAGYELPLVWMPQNVDNSPGGEVWVTGGKWGPWEGRMLHLSYGHCLLYGVTMETVDGVAQGAVVKFPFKFSSGVMRGRFNPKDGQLYVCGLNVWQSDAAKFGCFSRVRYTGAPVTMPVELHAFKGGVQLQFTGALDAASATDVQNYDIQRWNYKWTGQYGSDDYKVSDGSKGKDTVPVEKAVLSPDRKTLTLTLPDMQPCMTMRLKFKIQSADGKPVEQEIHSTIHRVPVSAAK
jgi:hypothetical protein